MDHSPLPEEPELEHEQESEQESGTELEHERESEQESEPEKEPERPKSKGVKEELYDKIPLSKKQFDIIIAVLFIALITFLTFGTLIGNGIICARS